MTKKNPYIGPHEGLELELMLAGKKKLALFSDIVPPGGEIAEAIIPERAFAPYVAAGKLIRRSVDDCLSDSDVLRTALFALPGEEWRMDAALFIRRDAIKNQTLYKQSHADDIILGRLLGYTEDDISAFLQHRTKRAKAELPLDHSSSSG